MIHLLLITRVITYLSFIENMPNSAELLITLDALKTVIYEKAEPGKDDVGNLLTSLLEQSSTENKDNRCPVELFSDLMQMLVYLPLKSPLKKAFIHVLEKLLKYKEVLSDEEKPTWAQLITELVTYIGYCSSSERVHITLNVIPKLLSLQTNTKLPLPCSILVACCRDVIEESPTIGSELLCIITNNKQFFYLDQMLLESDLVWITLMTTLKVPECCLRVLNVLENILEFLCETVDAKNTSINVEVDGLCLFSFNESNAKDVISFWTTYLALFTSIETSHSSHTIDPFLAKVPQLVAQWAKLDISDNWLEVFCGKSCSLSNFSCSKRFLIELLGIDFTTTENSKALLVCFFA